MLRQLARQHFHFERHLGMQLAREEVRSRLFPGTRGPAVTALTEVRVAPAEPRQTLLRVLPRPFPRYEHVQPMRRVREGEALAGADGRHGTTELLVTHRDHTAAGSCWGL